MKPMNFPQRKAKRQIAARLRKNGYGGTTVDDVVVSNELRDIRTKKNRGPKSSL